MSWLFWLSVAVVVSVLFTVMGGRTRGARPVANTRMMAVARIVLLITVVVLFYLAMRERMGR